MQQQRTAGAKCTVYKYKWLSGSRIDKKRLWKRLPRLSNCTDSRDEHQRDSHLNCIGDHLLPLGIEELESECCSRPPGIRTCQTLRTLSSRRRQQVRTIQKLSNHKGQLFLEVVWEQQSRNWAWKRMHHTCKQESSLYLYKCTLTRTR